MADHTAKAARRALRHVPVSLPRAGVPREQIYLDLWRDYLAANRDAVLEVFRDLCQPLDQRGARVAASFMVWMGCNGGMAFTHEAENLARSLPELRRCSAFVAAWAIHNTRCYGTNSGAITTEAMLTRGGIPHRGDCTAWPVDWQRVVSPSQYDNDVISCMVRWWAGPVAGEMREIASSMVEAQRVRDRAIWLKEHAHA